MKTEKFTFWVAVYVVVQISMFVIFAFYKWATA